MRRFLLRFESKPGSLASPALHRAKTRHFTTVYGHVHIKISVHDVRNIRRCTNVYGRHKLLLRLNACANSVNQAFLFPPRRLGTRLLYHHSHFPEAKLDGLIAHRLPLPTMSLMIFMDPQEPLKGRSKLKIGPIIVVWL